MSSFLSYRKQILLMIIVLLFSLNSVFFINLLDPIYFYVLTDFYKESVMGCFSLFIGHIWRLATLDNLLVFRFGSWLLSLAAFFLPYFVLIHSKERKDNLGYLIIGLVFFLINLKFYTFFSFDIMTLICLVAIGCFILKRRCVTIEDAMYLGSLSAVATASRFPNILIIPLLCVYLLLYNYVKKRGWRNALLLSSLYLCVSLILYYCIVVVLTGNFDVFSMIKDSMSNTSSDSRHNISSLVSNYIDVAIKHGLLLLLLIIVGYGLTRTKLNFNNIHWSLRLFVVCSLFVVMLLFGKDQMPAFLIIVLFLIIIYRECFVRNRIKKWSELIKYVVLLLMGLIGAAGSDTGFLKAAPYYICFSPIVLIYFDHEIRTKRFCKELLSVFVIFSIYNSFFRVVYFEEGSHTPIYHFCHYYENSHVTSFVSESWLERFHEIESTMNLYMVKDHTHVYGDSYLAFLISGEKQIDYLDFWQYSNNKSQINKVMNAVARDKHAVLIDFSKSNDLEKIAKDEGMIILVSNNANVYNHNDNSK